MEKFRLSDVEKLQEGTFYVICNGKLVENWRQLNPDDVFHVVPRVLGGKGGRKTIFSLF